MDERLVSRETLLKLVEHFGGCTHCCETHGSYPESISCYCDCHRGAAGRWPELEKNAIAALTEAKEGT